MKKVFVTALTVVFALSMAACDNKAKTENTVEGEEIVANQEEGQEQAKVEKRKTGKKLRNISDSISYAIGADMGRALLAQKDNFAGDINLAYLVAGIKETMKERGTLAEEEIGATIQNYFMNVVPERTLAEGRAFLEKIEKETPGIQKTESGILYIIENPGSDVKATNLQDQVEVQYTGTLRTGDEFDSSFKRGKPATFALNNVIKGWSEGIMLIGEGGKIKLWIPTELAYGKMGGGRAIKGNEPVIFEVELLKVIPAEVEAEEGAK